MKIVITKLGGRFARNIGLFEYIYKFITIIFYCSSKVVNSGACWLPILCLVSRCENTFMLKAAASSLSYGEELKRRKIKAHSQCKPAICWSRGYNTFELCKSTFSNLQLEIVNTLAVEKLLYNRRHFLSSHSFTACLFMGSTSHSLVSLSLLVT